MGSGFISQLRTAAPHLSRRFFGCQASSYSPICQRAFASSRPRTSPRVSSIRTAISKRWISASTKTANTASVSHTGPAVLDTAASSSTQIVRSSSFPDTSSNAVAYWLLASAASVFGIVVFGGWTRLTESGLATSYEPLEELH